MSEMYFYLIKYPADTVLMFDDVINDLYKKHFVSDDEHKYQQHQIKTRISHLRNQVNFRTLNPNDINQLIQVKGIVIRTSKVIPEIKQAMFVCDTENCSGFQQVDIEKERIIKPVICHDCGTRHSMVLLPNQSRFNDKQFVKFQERPDDVP